MKNRKYLVLIIIFLLSGCTNKKEFFEGELTYIYTDETKLLDKPDTVRVYLKNGNCRIEEIVNERLFIMDKEGTYLINADSGRYFPYYLKECYDLSVFDSLRTAYKNKLEISRTGETVTIDNAKCSEIIYLDSLDVPEGTRVVPFWEYRIYIDESYKIKKFSVAEHSEIDEVEYVLEQGYLPTYIKKTYRGEVKYGKLTVAYKLIKIEQKKLDESLFKIPTGFVKVNEINELY